MNLVFLMEAKQKVDKQMVGVEFGAEIAWDDGATLVRMHHWILSSNYGCMMLLYGHHMEYYYFSGLRDMGFD